MQTPEPPWRKLLTWMMFFRLKQKFNSTCSPVLVGGQWSLRRFMSSQIYPSLFGSAGCFVSPNAVGLLCRKWMSSCYQMPVFALVSKVWVEIRDECVWWVCVCVWWDSDSAHIKHVCQRWSVFIGWVRVDAALCAECVWASCRLI